MSLHLKIRQQLNRRIAMNRVGLKINLYTPAEVRAVAKALDCWPQQNPKPLVESLMVADSYLMTHLGRSTTQLKTKEDQLWGMDMMIDLVREVDIERRKSFNAFEMPYLVGDFPDGAVANPKLAVESAKRMMDAGADIVKIEVTSNLVLESVLQIVQLGIPVMAHIGYTPQAGANRRYGDTIVEAMELIKLARKIKAAGAVALVLERVTEALNILLSAPNPGGLQVYSIFSGKAPLGGQSLNVWDSVFRPSFDSQFFPPTAEFTSDQKSEVYTESLIATKMTELMSLTTNGRFPKSPGKKYTPDFASVLSMINLWDDYEVRLQDALPLQA